MDRIPPIIRFVVLQALALAGTAGLAQCAAVSVTIHGWGWVWVDAALATVLAILLRLPWWWWPVAAALPLTVAAAEHADLPWWAWCTALTGLLLIYGGGIATRVPLYLSNQAASHALVKLLPIGPGIHACDLGAGLGGPLTSLARSRRDALILGVESSPLPWFICWFRCLNHPNAHVHFGNIFAHDLATYDLVYVFLSPAPMTRLWTKAKAEMRPGSLLVSNTFAVPDIPPEQTIDLPGRNDARLFVYRM